MAWGFMGIAGTLSTLHVEVRALSFSPSGKVEGKTRGWPEGGDSREGAVSALPPRTPLLPCLFLFLPIPWVGLSSFSMLYDILIVAFFGGGRDRSRIEGEAWPRLLRSKY